LDRVAHRYGIDQRDIDWLSLRAELATVTREREEARAALKALLSFDAVRWATNCGPVHEGWQSNELEAAIAKAEDIIATAPQEQP
jgi:hypothetical protein